MNAGETPLSVDLAREPDFRIGGLEVRPSTREAISGHGRELLEPRIMQVLVALARRRGRVISRDELVAECWGGHVVGEDAIQRAVAGVRRLGESHGAYSVETVRRVGYRLDAPIRVGAPRRRGRSRRWYGAAALGASIVGATAVLLWRGLPPPPPPAAAEARVAILPFETLTGGPRAAAFAGGLMDEILSVLSANQAAVVSRTESAALRTQGADAIHRLGAGLLLDGTIEEAADRIKVRVHLDDAATHTTLWSEAFERPATEAEPLQAEVAAKATTLAVYALTARSAGLANDVVADSIAADEHIRFDWNGGLQSAEPILRRVIQRAPRFAPAHGALSVALAFQSGLPGNPRAAEQRAEATREAQTAAALDRRGYGAYAVLALMRPRSDWAGREALMRKGMALDPSYAGYPYIASGELAHAGRLKAAEETARRGVALDPLWPGPTWALGLRQLETGRQSEGLATFDRMARIWPEHEATRLGRFWATAMYGDPDAALALLSDPRTAITGISPQGAALWRAYLAAAKSGRLEDRFRAAQALRAGARAGDLPPGPVAAMLARLGDVDGAFAAANQYIDEIDSTDVTEPAFLFVSASDPLRRDPRFMGLVARLGLPQYWRSSGQWPDYCSEAGLPYDCKAEAAKAVAEGQTR